MYAIKFHQYKTDFYVSGILNDFRVEAERDILKSLRFGSYLEAAETATKLRIADPVVIQLHKEMEAELKNLRYELAVMKLQQQHKTE